MVSIHSPFFDSLTATSAPYHAQPQDSPLPSPQPLCEDDSRDQSMLGLGASTIRLVTTAPTAPSPPLLRPFTPTIKHSSPSVSPSMPTLFPSLPVDQVSDPLPPGGFPRTFSTPSGPPKVFSSPSLPPFVFGSPAHRISNNEFNFAAASVLAEMNTRLGLTGTANEVGLDLLQTRCTTDAPLLSGLQDLPRTQVTSMFDKAHERQFQKMEGIGDWYARRNGASPGRSGPQSTNANRKRKSDALGGPHRRPIGPSNARAKRTSRVVTPGTRPSLVAAAEVDMDGRKLKRVRMSVVHGGDKKVVVAADKKNVDDSGDEDDETPKTIEERERERAAIKKKLEVSRARRRSSMGRVSVGAGKPPLIPNKAKKGMATRFGFLSSAKNIVKNVWKGVQGGALKQNSTIPVTGPPQKTAPPATKKSTLNILTKQAPATKANVPKPPVARTSTAKPDPNTSLRIPTNGTGSGRKIFTKNSTSSIARTRSSTASSGTSSLTPASASGIPARRRGAIPSFQQSFGRMSRTNNNLAGVGEALGSSSGTGSLRGLSSAANSIGLNKSGVPSGVLRPSDVANGSTSSVVRKRTSTLSAPTASSLAKMQSAVKPASLSSAASRPSTIALAKVQERRSPTRGGMPSFTFTSPASGGGALIPSGRSGSTFSNGAPSFPPPHVPTSEAGAPKPRAPPARRPRISRSRVIARVGALRAASGSSLSRTPSGRRSFNVPKTRGSLGVRASGVGEKNGARDSAAMSARSRVRQSEILRRRSKLSEVSLAHLDRDGNRDRDITGGDPRPGLDISMEG